jgi:hypothetical protein
MLTLLQSLRESALGTWVREGNYSFQAVAAVHVLSLMLSVGMMIWFDFRLIGVLAAGRISTVYRRLIPWATVGFVLMLVSGAILFTGYATEAYPNVYFRVKMATIALAGVNALVYHLFTERRVARWEHGTPPVAAARIAGVASLVLWAAVIICGRMMSYTIF